MFDYTKLDESEIEYYEIAELADIENGGRIFVEIDGEPIVVFNVAGKIYAIANVCSHDGNPLDEAEIEGDEIICPRHGARFNICSGKATRLPAVIDIPAYPVRIIEDSIEIGLPREK